MRGRGGSEGDGIRREKERRAEGDVWSRRGRRPLRVRGGVMAKVVVEPEAFGEMR